LLITDFFDVGSVKAPVITAYASLHAKCKDVMDEEKNLSLFCRPMCFRGRVFSSPLIGFFLAEKQEYAKWIRIYY
jgi:hypothetical protein